MGKQHENRGDAGKAKAKKATVREEVLRKKYEKLLADLDRETRHDFVNCLSSVRIALGAYHSGEIPMEEMKAFFDAMIEREQGLGRDISFHYDEFFDQSIAFDRMTMDIPKEEPLKSRMGCRKVLLADDDCRKLGWDRLFEAIFGKNNCYFAETPEETLTLLAETDDVDLIYLDLRFPNTAEEGLETLKQIKTKRLDIPVIVFTADDSSRHVTKCIQYGAESYFAKQLSGEDKNSLTYFLKFREVTLDAIEKKRQKDIWLRIVKLERAVREKGPPYYDEIFSYLRKAYYYLNLETETLIYNTLFEGGKTTHFSEVIIQSALSLEHTIGLIYNKNKNNPFIKKLRDTADTTLGKTIQALSAINALSTDQSKRCREINDSRNNAVHAAGKRQKTLAIDESVAHKTLSDVINLQKELVIDKLLNISYEG